MLPARISEKEQPAQRWGLPPLLEQFIGQHHQPPDIDEFGQMTALAHLTNGLAQSLEQDEMITSEGQEGQVWEACCQALGACSLRA